MTSSNKVVFLFDVDNTMLDNDRVQDDLRNHLEHEFGAETRDRYFAILEELYAELGYADYLGALQRYRLEDMCDPRLLMMSSFLVDYPFANQLYPGSLAALEHVRSWGAPVILSDGDVVFQPRKVQRSGLWEAVEGRVLIYIHKEQMLDDVERLSAQQVRLTDLAGEEIQTILTHAPGNGASIGGLKVIAESGWFTARPSGTEDIYKIYAESFRGADHLRRILEEAQTIVNDALAAAPQR